MPDFDIFTGSGTANTAAVSKRLIIREITVDFIIKQYHNGRLTGGENEEISDFCYLCSLDGSICTAKLSADWQSKILSKWDLFSADW